MIGRALVDAGEGGVAPISPGLLASHYAPAAQVRLAAEACRDRLVNDRGRRAGIDPLSLFMGPERRALAYASEELIDHWRAFPRVTFADYERMWLRDREAEAARGW